MDIQVTEQGDYTILKLSGDIDYFNISLLKTAIFQLINDKIPKLILDLKDVKYMDSSGIGLIVTAYKVMNRYGGTIGLMHVIDEIQVLLKLATVDSFLTIYSNEEELK
jgi:anti-sigma B factor antagonist